MRTHCAVGKEWCFFSGQGVCVFMVGYVAWLRYVSMVGYIVWVGYVSMVGYVVWVGYVSMVECVAVDRNTALILLKQGCQAQQMKLKTFHYM